MSNVVAHITDAAPALINGGVGVIPTDTVYGVVCRAGDEVAVSRLYELKQREQKPGTIIAASTQQFEALGIPARYLKPIAHYWPNPVSIVVPVGFRLPYLHQGKGSLALRIPKDDTLLQLLEQTGPLLTSSANHPGKPPAETVQQAIDYFGDAVDFYVDGGQRDGSLSSTVIRIVDDAIEILRQGAIKINESGEIEDDI